jgi:hypothetical protein
VVGFGYLLIVRAGLPGGATLLVLFMGYLPASVTYVTWTFGLDELIDGLTVFLIYVLLPGLPLLVLGWLAGFWGALSAHAPWLVPA